MLGKGMFSEVGKLVGDAVETAAKQAALKIQQDKKEFVAREQNRVNALLQDKLTSMKKIMQYNEELKNFAEGHRRLNDDISMNKAANSLIQACMNGLYNDKQYMAEIRERAETAD